MRWLAGEDNQREHEFCLKYFVICPSRALSYPFCTLSLASDWILPMRGNRKRFARGERIESQDVRFPMSSLHIFGVAVSVLLS